MIPMKPCVLPVLRIVVLAAGFSTRLGRSKALTTVRGVSLLAGTLTTLAPFRGGLPIIVVVPPRAGSYRRGRQPAGTQFIVNKNRARGLASSVRAGLGAARHSAAVLLLPVDLVNLTHRDIAHLIARWRGARRRVAARRVAGGAGTPLILPCWLYSTALTLAGDQGLRDVVRRLPRAHLALLDLPSAGADVDTIEDLARARARACRTARGRQSRALCTSR